MSTEKNVLSLEDGWGKFIKLFVVCAILSIIGEAIGTKSISVGPGSIIILPMIFAMVLGIAITPDALGKKIKGLKNIIGDKEVELSQEVIMLVLLILGVKLGTAAGPNVQKLIEAGPALVLQEFGNLGTMLIGLPFAMLLGMRREAVGATVSICREPSLGLISERYGIDSPEGTGVMGTYMVGNLFGTIFFGLLGSLSVLTGLHPYALAMASGMGSGSMMAAASQALASSVAPEYVEGVMAYAATSNIMTNVTGLYMELFISLPVANFLYGKLSKLVHKNSKEEEVK